MIFFFVEILKSQSTSELYLSTALNNVKVENSPQNTDVNLEELGDSTSEHQDVCLVWSLTPPPNIPISQVFLSLAPPPLSCPAQWARILLVAMTSAQCLSDMRPLSVWTAGQRHILVQRGAAVGTRRDAATRLGQGSAWTSGWECNVLVVAQRRRGCASG